MKEIKNCKDKEYLGDLLKVLLNDSLNKLIYARITAKKMENYPVESEIDYCIKNIEIIVEKL